MEQLLNKSLVLKRTSLYNLLLKHSAIFAKVVPFLHQEDRLLLMDFTSSNTTLADEVVNDTAAFSNYVNALLRNYAYGIGGYDELRTLSSSALSYPAVRTMSGDEVAYSIVSVSPG